MIPVLPESTVSAFAAIEFLACFSGDQLNRFGNRFIPVIVIIDKKVNMMGGAGVAPIKTDTSLS